MESLKIPQKDIPKSHSDKRTNSTQTAVKVLSKRKMGTTGLVMVSGGLVAWQVYNITASHSSSHQEDKNP